MKEPQVASSPLLAPQTPQDGLACASGATPEAEVVPYFHPKTVVGLDAQGNPKSYYGDPFWDVSFMGHDAGHSTKNLYFFAAHPLRTAYPLACPSLLSALIREQQKALVWLYMEGERSQSVIHQAALALTKLAQAAFARGIPLFDLMIDPQALSKEAASLSSNYLKSARAIIKILWRKQGFLRVEVSVRLKALQDALQRSEDNDPNKQTPLIPSRIYCSILSSLLASLDEIEQDLDELLDVYRLERLSSASRPQGLTERQHFSRRAKLLKDARASMRTRGWIKGSLREFVAGQISTAQLKLMSLVVAFTGMRIKEAMMLPLKGVVESINDKGGVHYVVNGFSSKLNKGRKKLASWITSREGVRAIELAKRIADAVCDVHRDACQDKDKEALLFPASENPCKLIAAATIYKHLDEILRRELCPIVEQIDIEELDALELAREWSRSDIEVGQPWPLRFHQLRRSLSVYAHASGLVTLPALKRQLQHITDEMRAYYSDGFCSAANLVFDKEHFIHEWREAKAESSFLGYSLAMLFGDTDLIGEVGGKGAQSLNRTFTGRTKAETLQLFRDGKLAYKETVLGGCASVEECDRLPLSPIPFDCLEKDCPNAVVFSKRLNLVIKSQEILVAGLAVDASGTVEHRLEVANLHVLLHARSRMMLEAS